MRLSEVKLELLAPVGKWEVLEAVIEAGADAVYLGGKQYNMRLHRKDYNFDQEGLSRAVEFVHARGKKLYVTVNSLLSTGEVEELPGYLEFLESVGVDAIIIQDLAAISVVRELGLTLHIHASTMMNVHSVEMAQELAGLGISRVITSRDISLSQVKEIHEKTGLEMEYFVHGDMCVAQSGLCYSSGVLFGKSANRGECMKPCRWNYTLIENSSKEKLVELSSGHFLAIKDLCLLNYLPELAHAGISSLKIEGRMRHVGFLKEVVSIYRRAIDSYLSSPFTYYAEKDSFERLYSQRVREVSTCSAFSTPGASAFDYSGRREPLFFSRAAREETLGMEDMEVNPFEGKLNGNGKGYSKKSLAVKVGSLGAVREALEGGADYVYLSGEVSPLRGQGWTLDAIKEASRMVHQMERKLAVGTPRITTGKEMMEVEWLLEKAGTMGFDAVLVQNLGTMRLARELGIPAIADYSFNVANPRSAKILQELGAGRITASLELSYRELCGLAEASPVSVECLAHGPIVGMTLEHCLPSLILSKNSGKEVCRLQCRYNSYALRDDLGEVRPIEVDQHCRNYIFLSKDLCVLPYLNSFLRSKVISLRIEAQYYADDVVGLVTEAYRRHMDYLAENPHNENPLLRSYWGLLLELSPRGLGLGAYKRGISRSRSTLEVMKSLAYAE
ncbi:MAG: peptidase U32 family protein [Candidatus Brocadiales bacterium]